jgi:hypothetical protein
MIIINLNERKLIVMKKLFSLLLVVAMLASLSMVASAAGNNVLSTEIVETTDGIVATVYVTNPNNLSGLTAGFAIPTTLSSDKSYTAAADFAKAKVTPGTKAGYVKFALAFSDTADYVTKEGKVEVLSFALTRADEAAVYASADFSYPTSGLYCSKVMEGTTEYNTKTAGHAAYFVAPVYTDSRAPIVEDKWEAGEDVVADAFKADLDAKIDYVKAIAVFGKNAAGTDYTVTFGANSYAGTAVVGQPWAMVLYDDGSLGYDLIGADSYAYTVTAGEATWSGTATAITK